MNYIKHLNGFFLKVAHDNEGNPSLVSLYMALFRAWNQNRFQNPISITRDELMHISKISAKATYLKGLKDLNDKGFIRYTPSFNPYKGSTVSLINLEDYTGTKCEPVAMQLPDQKADNSSTSTLPAIKNTNRANEIQKNTNNASDRVSGNIPPAPQEVIAYFEARNSTSREAEKYSNYYTAKNWHLSNNTKMTNWKAAANHWITNASKFKANHVPGPVTGPQPNHLQTTKTKSYDEPL